jgi:S-adenosylmethionine decarboxylase
VKDSTVSDQVYGMHLMLRLSQIERIDAIDDSVRLGEFLVSLVRKIGMKVVNGPHLASEEGSSQTYGHSAVVILSESHASVHTYPRREELFLDVFSCRPFDQSDVMCTCEEFFGRFVVSERTLLDRGYHWHASASASLSMLADQRKGTDAPRIGE